MPVYKDESAGTYYFKINYKQDGKYKQKLRRGFTTKKAATAAMAEVETEINQGTYIEPLRESYGVYMSRWIQDKASQVKRRTLATYSGLVNNHIIPALGELPVGDITPRHIQDYYNELARTGRLSGENVQKVHTIINESLRRAAEWELIRKNPAALVDRPKADKKEMKFWTKEQAHTFLEAAKDDRYYASFLLALTTGMRQGEILGLRWKDVDQERRILAVTQILTHDAKGFEAGAKTLSGVRSIGLDVRTVEALEKLRRRTEAERRDARGVYADHDLVICTAIGTPVSPRNINRSFYRLMDQADVPRIRFHDLRHTHVVMLLQARENNKRIAERLGWSSVKMIDRYAHVMPDMRQETADLFGAAFYGSDTNADTNRPRDTNTDTKIGIVRGSNRKIERPKTRAIRGIRRL